MSAATKLSLSQLRSTLATTAAVQGGATTLFVGGASLGAAGRKALLKRVQDGEKGIEVEFEATTYIQRDTPNRNFVRFPDKATALKAIAESGKGAPFLRDHDQQSVMSRGGTVIASRAEKNEAGEWEFKQRIKLVKPWAVEGVLDGTIDRFSIGWFVSGEITYRHSGKEVEEYPEHYPGDELEDGTQVEYVFESADLVEVSAVNVPAVTGTSTEEITPALTANVAAKREEFALSAAEALAQATKLTADAEQLRHNIQKETAAMSLKTASNSPTPQGQATLDPEARVQRTLAASPRRTAARKGPHFDQGRVTRLNASRMSLERHAELSERRAQVASPQLEQQMKAVLGAGAPAVHFTPSRLERLRQSKMSPERHAELAQKRAQRMGDR